MRWLQPRFKFALSRAEGVPLKFCNGAGAQKLEGCPCQVIKKVDDLPIRFAYTQYHHWTGRQTDGFAITVSRSACIACWRAIKKNRLKGGRFETRLPFGSCRDFSRTTYSIQLWIVQVICASERTVNNCAEITLQQHVGVDLGTIPVEAAALVLWFCFTVDCINRAYYITTHIIHRFSQSDYQSRYLNVVLVIKKYCEVH